MRTIHLAFGVLLTTFFALVTAGCTARSLPAASADTLSWQAANQGLTPHVPVAAIAFDPHQADRMVAGAYDPIGLLESPDRGQSWHADDSLRQPLHALLFDRQLPGVLWAASADGLYQGKRDGELWSWQRVADWPPARAAFAVVQNSAGTRYAGGQGDLAAPPAVWRSEDGQRWRPLAALPLPEGGAVLSVAVTAERLLAGTDGLGLFVSGDGGESWSQAREIGETYVAALWVAPWDGDLLLARTRKGLFRSIDGAVTWQRVGEGLEGRPDAVAAGAQRSIYLGMSTGAVLRSVDGGESWQPWGTVGRDGLFYVLISDPRDASRLYAGTHFGLYRSQDRGRTWAQVDSVGVFRATALAQNVAGRLFLGNDDGIYVLDEQPGPRWRLTGQTLPQRTVWALAASGDDPNLLFAGTDTGALRSTDGGASWQSIGWPERGVPGLLLDPSDPNRLYIRLAFERIYSTDEALAAEPRWIARWEGMPQTSEILSMALDPEEPSRLYAGGAVDFFSSDDASASWQAIGAELRGQTIFTVAVDDAQPRRVYAGATNGLYRSEDRGATWSPLGLKDFTVTAVVWDAARPQTLYAGSKHRGVWRSVDGGQTWQAQGPADVTIHALLIAADGRRLLAATESGLWQATLP